LARIFVRQGTFGEIVTNRGVADGGAFLVGGEEGGFVEARPQGFAFGREGFDGVPGLRRGRLRSGHRKATLRVDEALLRLSLHAIILLG
jgi:hypothetical protein